MRVIWQTNARQGRNQIVKYIQQYFGTNRRDKFLQQVRETTRLLKKRQKWMVLDDQFFTFENMTRVYSVLDLLKVA